MRLKGWHPHSMLKGIHHRTRNLASRTRSLPATCSRQPHRSTAPTLPSPRRDGHPRILAGPGIKVWDPSPPMHENFWGEFLEQQTVILLTFITTFFFFSSSSYSSLSSLCLQTQVFSGSHFHQKQNCLRYSSKTTSCQLLYQ
jgi:hypothetical protein